MMSSMKNRFTIAAFILGLIVVNSCEKKVPSYEYDGPSFVAFDKAQVRGTEGKDSLAIIVLCSEPGRTDEVTINFSVTMGANVDESDFQVLNPTSSVTFKPGQGEAAIGVKLKGDVLTDEGLEEVVFTITSVSKNGMVIGLPGPDRKNSSCVLQIQNACLLMPGIFEGDVKGKETPLGQTWWVDYETDWKWEMIREVKPGVIEYNVTGFWAAQFEYWQNRNGDALPFTYYPVKVTLDLSNPANPLYSIEEAKCATCAYGDYYTKSFKNQPLPVINVCDRYIELPYTLNSGWATSYIFNVKFQF